MKLYVKYFSIHIRSVMQYKTSFFLSILGQFLVSFNVFLGVFFMFQRFHQVEGFIFSQVVLCYGILLLEFSLAEAFGRGFDTFPTMLGNGEFDRILARPRNEIFQVLASKVEFTRIGRVLQAVVMFVYGISASHIQWNWLKVVTVVCMLLGGVVLFCAIFLLYAAISFFTIQGLECLNILTDGVREYGRYPVSVYGKRALQFCTFVVPYALVQYYPLLYLLDMRQESYLIFLPLAAAWFLLPSWLLWKVGVRKYRSTGS